MPVRLRHRRRAHAASRRPTPSPAPTASTSSPRSRTRRAVRRRRRRPFRVVAYDFGIKRRSCATSEVATVEVVPASTPRRRGAGPQARRRVPLERSRRPGGRHRTPSTHRRPCSARCRSSASASATSSSRSRSAATTYKLPFGHHGGNHPVRRLATNAVEITSQNHNYAVAEGSLATADVTHVNLNDGVIEGLRLSRTARLLGAVPPRGRTRSARRPLPLRRVQRRSWNSRRASAAPRRHRSILLIGSGPIVIGQACEFDYSGTQACRVLRDEGYRVILANSNPATIMTDPDFADRTYVEPLDIDVLTAIIEREQPDAVLPTLGGQTALNLAMELARARRARDARRRAHRRQRRGHRDGRGPREVQGGDDRDRPRRAGVGFRLHARRGDRGRRRDRLPDDRPPVVHPRRRRHRHRRRRRRAARASPARPRRQPDQRDPHRALDRGLEGVRARGHARPRRQLRRRLLDREPRPHGRAHRRLDHGRAGADAVRRRVPAHARRRLRVHPPHRRRDRRLQHPVRGQPGRRRHGRHRDEPAGEPLERAGVEGHRVPDRQDRGPASPSATRSTRSPTTSPGRRRRASSRRSTTSSPRCRAGRSRSSRVRPACSARGCSRSARPWRSAARSPSRCRRACARSSTAGWGLNCDPAEAALDDARRRRARAPCRDRHARPPVPARGRAAARHQRRAPARQHAGRSVVPRPDPADHRGAGPPGRRRLRRHDRAATGGAPSGSASATRSWRSSWGVAEDDVRRPRARRRRAAPRSRRSTPAAPSSTPRRRTTTRPTRTRTRCAPSERPQDRHPRLGPEPHRPGHRVRLLLRARQLRAARRRLRDDHDQLQPRDRLDRLRHERPPLLRAAHRRGRAQRHRGRAARRAGGVIVQPRRPDAAQAGGRACRRARRSAQRPSRSTWPKTASAGTRLCARLEIPQPAGGTAVTVDDALAITDRIGLPGAGAPELRARRPGHADRLRRRRPARGHGRAGRLRLARHGRWPVGRAAGARRPLPRRRHRGRRRRHPRRAPARC